MLDINFSGAFLISKQALAEMISRGGGAMGMGDSVQSVATPQSSVAYVVSMHAILGPIRSIALDYNARAR